MLLLLLLLLLADGGSCNRAAVSACHVVDVFSLQCMGYKTTIFVWPTGNRTALLLQTGAYQQATLSACLSAIAICSSYCIAVL